MNETLFDLRFPLARNLIVAGPSCCGKSWYVRELIDNRANYFHPPPQRTLYYYGEVCPSPPIKGVEYKRGLPTEEDIERMNRCLVVLDDLMWEARSSMSVGNLFTRVAHHRECFIIHITQNLFQGGKVTRTQSLNAHYLVLFKNPRDRQQILYLARQIYPRQEDFVLRAFEDATERPYGYLLIDLNPTMDDRLRLRTINIDKQMIVYIPPEKE